MRNSSLYVKVAKTTIIPANHVGNVMGVINNFETIRRNPIVVTSNQNSQKEIQLFQQPIKTVGFISQTLSISTIQQINR